MIDLFADKGQYLGIFFLFFVWMIAFIYGKKHKLLGGSKKKYS